MTQAATPGERIPAHHTENAPAPAIAPQISRVLPVLETEQQGPANVDLMKTPLISYGFSLVCDEARPAMLGLFHEGHHITIEDPETGEERPAEVRRHSEDNATVLISWLDMPTDTNQERRAAMARFNARSIVTPLLSDGGSPTHYRGREILLPNHNDFMELFHGVTTSVNEKHPRAAKFHDTRTNSAIGMKISNYAKNGLSVQCAPETAKAIARKMTPIDYDSIYFEVSPGGDTAAVYAEHNIITGSRVLAIVRPDTIPAEALTIEDKGRKIVFCWFGGESQYIHIYRNGKECGLWSHSAQADRLTPQEVRESINDQITSGYFRELMKG